MPGLSLGLGLGLSSPKKGGGAPPVVTPYVAPGGFGGVIPFNISRVMTGDVQTFRTDFSMAAVKPTPTHTVYVGAGGNNANDGLTWATRVRSLKQGLTHAGALGVTASIIRLLVQEGRYLYSNQDGGGIPDDFSGVSPHRAGLIIEPCDASGNVSNGFFYPVHNQIMPAFATVGSNVYCSTYTTELPQRSVWDEGNLDAEGDPVGVPNVPGSFANEAAIIAGITAYHSSPAAAGGGEGGIYLDTVAKKLYVRLKDGRAPDANVYVGRGELGAGILNESSRGFYQSGVYFTPKTVWVRNMRCYGGVNWFYAFNPQGHTLSAYLADCRFLYSGYNGVAVFGDVRLTSLRSTFGYTQEDGIGYTLPDGAGSVGFTPGFYELDCIFKWNGQDSATDASKNASSTHDTIKGVTTNPRARKSQNRTFNDIAASQRLILNPAGIEPPRQAQAVISSGYSLAAASTETTKVWVDGSMPAGATYDFEGQNGGVLYYANLGRTPVMRTVGGGAVSTYNSPPVVPGATGTLSATAASSSMVQLTFANATGATGYKYRLNGGGSWLALASDKIATGLTQLTAYTFEVRATNTDGDGPVSNSAGATTPAAPGPTSVFSGGTMDSQTGWNAFYANSGFTMTGGKMVFTNVTQFNTNSKALDVTLTPGKYYEVSFDLVRTAGTGRVGLTGSSNAFTPEYTTSGLKVSRVLAGAGMNALGVQATSTGGGNLLTGSIDDLTVYGPYDTSTVGGA